MYLRDEQSEEEMIPSAYHLTIWLVSRKSSAVRYSLENYPDRRQQKMISETISENIYSLGYDLRLIKIGKQKIEIIVKSPANVEKIINGATLSIIEFLRKSDQFSEQINLWQPETNVRNLWTRQQLEAAVETLKDEK